MTTFIPTVGLLLLHTPQTEPQRLQGLFTTANADSTDYLGATGTLLSYNLFAYCENDPVGCVDPSGCYVSGCAFTLVPGMSIYDMVIETAGI